MKCNLEGVLLKIFTRGTTTNENIFHYLVQDDDSNNKNNKGAWLRVYTKDVIYVGKIYYTENKYSDGNKYIILSAYQSYDNTFSDILEDNSEDSKCRVMINMKDITIIEKVTGEVTGN